MSDQNTTPRRRLHTVVLTITEAGVRRTNSNGKPFVLAKGRSNSGRAITAMTHKNDMMELLMATPVGRSVRVYGTFEERTFSPIGLSVPKVKAPAAAA